MKLSSSETDTLISKLREKYDECAAKYSKKWFDRKPFEDRFKYALVNRMDLNAFILAEIASFEQLRAKYEQAKNKHSFSEKIDKIIDAQIENIKKYDPLKFHQNADFETPYMAGALAEFASSYFPILWIIVPQGALRDVLLSLDRTLDSVGALSGSRLPQKLEDYALFLSRKGTSELDNEKAKNAYLKEAAFLLHECADFCDEVVSQRLHEFELPIQFSKTHISQQQKQLLMLLFGDKTGYGALITVRDRAIEIIEDFRLRAFKRPVS